MISIIVAYDENRVIGSDGEIPWRIPGDLPRFKKLTNGHPVIMGRKTHESIGRALPGRTNIVVSRNNDYRPREGVCVISSFSEALAFAEMCEGSNEVFIIGGAEIYKEALSVADRIYATEIHAAFDGDVYFPEKDESLWEKASEERQESNEEETPAFSYVMYERRKS